MLFRSDRDLSVTKGGVNLPCHVRPYFKPYLLFNCSDSLERKVGTSTVNDTEALVVAQLLFRLRKEYPNLVNHNRVALISPYRAQLTNLIQKLKSVFGSEFNRKLVEVNTIDGFQGREKEAILLTMVRCNDRQEIGFLADTRRTNVAMTRARRCLMMVGDSATLGSNAFYASLLEHFDQQNTYRSVWEFLT